MEEWIGLNSSPLNFVDEVKEETFVPSKVFIHDTTLRDGEQFPGVVFNREDKVRIGQALSEYGVHRIELMPAVSDDDFEAASKLNSMGLSAEIIGFCRSVKSDIEKAADAGCRAIQMEMTTYPLLLEAFEWSFDQATGTMIEASHFAKEKGLRVSGFFMLITQAEPDFAEKFIKKVLAEGAIDAVTLPDTLGTCLPQAIYHFVRRVRQWTDKPIEIHAHNTYSMGAACTLAGVMAGAEIAHVSVNGLGEGCGNAPLEAVAMDLSLMLGMNVGLKLEKTYEICRLVSDLSGIPLQSNWPLVGEKVFTTESGIAVDAYFKMALKGVNIPPDKDVNTVLGRERNVVVGKMSGRTSMEVKMLQLGIQSPGEGKVGEILNRVKTLSTEMRRELTDDEFKEIVSSVAKA